MYRRCAIMLLVIILGITSFACGGSSSPPNEPTMPASQPSATAIVEPDATSTRPPTPTFAPTITPTPSPTPEPTPTLEPTPVPVAQNGTGNANVNVELTAGLTLVTLRHFGRDRFKVRLLEESGEARAQIADDRGAFQGSRAIALMESGAFVVEIVADGDWELEITHPIPTEAIVRDLPLDVSGTGTQAIYFVKATPGLHTVTLTHDGRRPFNVSVMNSQARQWDRIIQANGAFSGTAAISVRNEPFDYLIFDIRADGNWTMTID